MVRAKKYLGQHFLVDKNIARKITDSLHNTFDLPVIEIGPGTGILTQFLANRFDKLFVIEIDEESVEYLNNNFPNDTFTIIHEDFLKIDFKDCFQLKEFCLVGNFPYNISSQIFFKVLENKELIPEATCMVQKEMAERIFSTHGNKTYGILSVLIQLFYKAEYLFTVNEKVFRPPPKVKSGVIRLTRYRDNLESVDENKLFKIVKMAFNQRRKVLRNSLKSFITNQTDLSHEYFAKRPEQLSPECFIKLHDII